MQTFNGDGTVWISPTQGGYEQIVSIEDLRELAGAPGSMSTMTDVRKVKKSK